MDKYLHHNGYEDIIRYIGMDAGEPRRVAKFENTEHCKFEFPLVIAGWFREQCVDAILKAGLALPPKSACFFCPSSKKHEVRELAVTHPDLLARAVEMERRAIAGEGQAQSPLRNMKGLGRSWSWAELVAAPESQLKVFQDVQGDVPCMCFDGETETDDL